MLRRACAVAVRVLGRFRVRHDGRNSEGVSSDRERVLHRAPEDRIARPRPAPECRSLCYFTEFSDGQARIETATRVVLGNTRDVLADFTFACCLLLVLLVQWSEVMRRRCVITMAAAQQQQQLL